MMRYPLSAPLLALLCLLSIGLISAGLPTDPKDSGRIPLSEALEKGLEVSFDKASGEELFSGHYGPCIQLTVENTSRKGIRTILPAGTWLHPGDSSEQNMLVTQERLLAVLPGQTRTVTVAAMCGEASDASPGSDAIFALGQRADDDLVGLAELIDRYNWQNETGQEAVWTLTDGHSLRSIDGEDEFMVSKLREYVGKVRKEPVPAWTPPDVTRFEIPKPSSQTVTGKVFYELKESSRVTVGIYTSEGVFVSPFIEDEEQRPGRHGFEFELDIYDTEAAPYWARVIVNGEEKVKQLVPIRESED